MGLKITAFFVRRLKKFDFPIPILITCLWSVLAPKQIDRFWCAWCQLLAFFKLYMIHVKKLKIDHEKAKLCGVEDCSIFRAPHCNSCEKKVARNLRILHRSLNEYWKLKNYLNFLDSFKFSLRWANNEFHDSQGSEMAMH